MAEAHLERAGLYVDDLNKVRVLDPEVLEATAQLRDTCQGFVDNIGHFQGLVLQFLRILSTVGDSVEKEKLQAIGTRNLLKTIQKQREARQDQLRALAVERRLVLERLKAQHDALLSLEADQEETLTLGFRDS